MPSAFTPHVPVVNIYLIPNVTGVVRMTLSVLSLNVSFLVYTPKRHTRKRSQSSGVVWTGHFRKERSASLSGIHGFHAGGRMLSWLTGSCLSP